MDKPVHPVQLKGAVRPAFALGKALYPAVVLPIYGDFALSAKVELDLHLYHLSGAGDGGDCAVHILGYPYIQILQGRACGSLLPDLLGRRICFILLLNRHGDLHTGSAGALRLHIIHNAVQPAGLHRRRAIAYNHLMARVRVYRRRLLNLRPLGVECGVCRHCVGGEVPLLSGTARRVLVPALEGVAFRCRRCGRGYRAAAYYVRYRIYRAAMAVEVEAYRVLLRRNNNLCPFGVERGVCRHCVGGEVPGVRALGIFVPAAESPAFCCRRCGSGYFAAAYYVRYRIYRAAVAVEVKAYGVHIRHSLYPLGVNGGLACHHVRLKTPDVCTLLLFVPSVKSVTLSRGGGSRGCCFRPVFNRLRRDRAAALSVEVYRVSVYGPLGVEYLAFLNRVSIEVPGIITLRFLVPTAEGIALCGGVGGLCYSLAER